jgi:hypothetical protein
VLGQKRRDGGDGGAAGGDAQLGDEHFRQFSPLRGVGRGRLFAGELACGFSKHSDEFGESLIIISGAPVLI